MLPSRACLRGEDGSYEFAADWNPWIRIPEALKSTLPREAAIEFENIIHGVSHCLISQEIHAIILVDPFRQASVRHIFRGGISLGPNDQVDWSKNI